MASRSSETGAARASRSAVASSRCRLLGAQAPSPPRPAQRAAERRCAARGRADSRAAAGIGRARDRRSRRCSSSCASSRSSAQLKVEAARGGRARRSSDAQRQLAATIARAAALQRRRRDASGPTSKPASCSCTRWGAPATGACCSTSTTCSRSAARIGPRRRSNRIDRERVERASAHAGGARQRSAQSLEAQARELSRAADRGACSARAAIERAVAARTALVDVDRRAARPERAAHRRAGGGAAAASGRPWPSSAAPERRRVALPLRPFQGALPWPADGVVIGRFGRQTRQPLRHRPSHATASRSRCRRAAGARRARGHGRVRRPVHRLRQPRHRRSRRRRVLALRLSGRRSTSHGATRSTPRRRSGLRPEPGGNPALYFELRVDGKPVDPLQWLKR